MDKSCQILQELTLHRATLILRQLLKISAMLLLLNNTLANAHSAKVKTGFLLLHLLVYQHLTPPCCKLMLDCDYTTQGSTSDYTVTKCWCVWLLLPAFHIEHISNAAAATISQQQIHTLQKSKLVSDNWQLHGGIISGRLSM